MKKNNKKSFTERFTEYETHEHSIKKILVHKKTDFQNVYIYDSYSFGKMLVLDGETQSSENDEFIYHELLVHPAILLHNKPKKVVILGGGEGATLKEILKYKSVSEVFMIDIDSDVVEFCKKYLTTWHKNAFSDSRAKIIIDDAYNFIVNSEDNSIDVIISDLPCPIECGSAYKLYTMEFYKILKKKLKTDGIFVLQAGSGSILQIDFHKKLFATLNKLFKYNFSYYEFIPSFDVPWAFIFCSDSYDPMNITPVKIEKMLEKNNINDLKFYDGTSHIHVFNVPKYLRKLLSQEKQIISQKKPVFFYK